MSSAHVALWDILGRRAKLPVYQLFGGKCRYAVDTYKHASGANFEKVEEAVRAAMKKGYRHVRVQVAVPGLATYGVTGAPEDKDTPVNARTRVWEPGPYVRVVAKLFEHLRKTVGDEVELLHEFHERVPPILGMQLVKDLGKFKTFFVEDSFAPEDLEYFRPLRQQSSTPLAMGKLFNNPNEWVGLVSG